MIRQHGSYCSVLLSLIAIMSKARVLLFVLTIGIPNINIIQINFNFYVPHLKYLQKYFNILETLPTFIFLTLSPSSHLPLRKCANMVETRQGTNTYDKEKKSTKKAKKPTVEAKSVINMHSVTMKGFVL